jgi:putative FmdB family regulatory protein
MPIYEYRCSGCGHETEVLQKMSDAPLTDCPSCGKSALTKLISAAGFQLKGSGWYVTDFRGGSKPKADPGAKGDDAAKGDGGAKDEARSVDKGGDKAASGTGEGGKSKETKSSENPPAKSAPAPTTT